MSHDEELRSHVQTVRDNNQKLREVHKGFQRVRETMRTMTVQHYCSVTEMRLAISMEKKGT